jgi:hypothetical protein
MLVVSAPNLTKIAFNEAVTDPDFNGGTSGSQRFAQAFAHRPLH